MGRKTFESIGRALPGRHNVVITSRRNYSPAGITVVGSLEDALEAAGSDETDECFVIGGRQVYEQSLPLACRLYLTEIYRDIRGDVLFPDFDRNLFGVVFREEHREGEPPFTFLIMERKVPTFSACFGTPPESG
jgi:dihydrofolate reductase